MKRRVVVTGIGCVTPIGNDVPTMWKAQQEGCNGVGTITHFDATRFPTKFAAEVRNYDFDSQVDDPARFADAGRNIRFAIGAANQAVQGSGIHEDRRFDPARFGIYLGAGEGQQNFEQFMSLVADSCKDGEPDLQRFTTDFIRRMNPRFELELEPNMPAAHLSSLFNAQGPNLNCLTACAASSQAIGEATEIIRRNDADIMLSGGAHSMIHPFGVTGFNLLTALSERNDSPRTASRPFDLNRDGFVLGEGAGMLILEELEHAKARSHRSMVKSGAMDRPRMHFGSPTFIRRAAEPSAASKWRFATPRLTPKKSGTSTLMAQARKSMTKSKRWRSRAVSGSTPGKRRFPVSRV